jgi:hypothetical protein
MAKYHNKDWQSFRRTQTRTDSTNLSATMGAILLVVVTAFESERRKTGSIVRERGIGKADPGERA